MPKDMEQDAAATLAALERIEAGNAGDQDLELAQLVAAIEAARPEPTPAFAAELDLQVQQGFSQPRQTSAPPAERTWFARHRLQPILTAGGTLAVVLVVAVAVAVNQQGAPTDSAVEPPSAATQEQSGAAAGTPSGTDKFKQDGRGTSGSGSPTATAPEPAIDQESLLAGRADKKSFSKNRKVEQSASLALAAAPDQIDKVASGVVATIDKHGGYVVSSSVATGDDSAQDASFELSVPQAKLKQTLAELSQLAKVRSRQDSSQDITSSFDSTQAELSDARAERQSLLRQLGRSQSAAQTASIRAQLRSVRGQIAGIEGRLDQLRGRANNATISLQLEADKGAVVTGGTFDDAVSTTGAILEGIAAALLVVVAVLLPIAAIAFAIWFGTSRVQRRRRANLLGEN